MSKNWEAREDITWVTSRVKRPKFENLKIGSYTRPCTLLQQQTHSSHTVLQNKLAIVTGMIETRVFFTFR